MKKIISIIICSFFVSATSFIYSQDTNKIFSTYEEMSAEVVKISGQGDYENTALILEKHIDKFPENLEIISHSLATCYNILRKEKKVISTLLYGQKNGIWYHDYYFPDEQWKNIKETKAFKNFMKNNEIIRKEAQKLSKSEILIIEPEEFSQEKEYPVFLALHGGFSFIERFKQLWKSEKMKNEFIVVFVQSSQLASMTSYIWEDKDIAAREITDAYNKVNSMYKIKTDEIIIGGFSSGGIASLETIQRSDIPIAGFIILSPPKPEDFSENHVKKMIDKNIRGTIITNPKDPRYKDQREMANVYKTNGMQYQFIDTPPIGHWFPDNLNMLIDQSIDFIRNK
ncbi:hypothetical protein ACFLTI_08350 [Bacteroidota bacterium]